jgi:DNA-binding NarL/FixJ family response regulator
MPVRILVVEDHASFRRLTCTALQRLTEFQTFEAVDGLEAVQQAEALQPDVILLDIGLPKLHGFEVAKRIRSLAPRATVLFLSQESSPDIVRKAFSLGARGYVQKLRAGIDLLPALAAVLRGERFVSSSIACTELADAPAAHRHEILFCSDDAAVVEGFAGFVGAALTTGDAAIALVTESHRHDLLQRMRTQRVDVDGAIARGTCLLLDADDAPDPDMFLEAINDVRQAATRVGKAHPRVAFCGERAGRLWAAGRTAEAVQLEQFCGELAHDVDVLCAYPVPCTKDDQALSRMCAVHTAVSAN